MFPLSAFSLISTYHLDSVTETDTGVPKVVKSNARSETTDPKQLTEDLYWFHWFGSSSVKPWLNQTLSPLAEIFQINANSPGQWC